LPTYLKGMSSLKPPVSSNVFMSPPQPLLHVEIRF